jgi:hypothetical protein
MTALSDVKGRDFVVVTDEFGYARGCGGYTDKDGKWHNMVVQAKLHTKKEDTAEKHVIDLHIDVENASSAEEAFRIIQDYTRSHLKQSYPSVWGEDKDKEKEKDKPSELRNNNNNTTSDSNGDK